MTEKEIRTEMKQRKWSFLCRKRRSKEYVYAARKVNKKRVECYICPLANLAEFSLNALIVKLNSIALPTQADQARSETTGIGQAIGLAG
jgi:hypothetical protein